MTDHNDPFGTHNLDHLHQRVASGRSRVNPSTAAHRVQDGIEVIAGRIAKSGGSLHLAVDAAGGWAASLTINDQLTPHYGYGNSHAEALGNLVRTLRPHVAAQEDDGEQD